MSERQPSNLSTILKQQPGFLRNRVRECVDTPAGRQFVHLPGGSFGGDLVLAGGAVVAISEMQLVDQEIDGAKRTLAFEHRANPAFDVYIEQTRREITIDEFTFRAWRADRYEVRLRNGRRYEMDRQGRVVRIVSENGLNAITVNYDGSAPRITTIVDELGRTVTVSYEEADGLQDIVGVAVQDDPLGRTVTYGYEGNDLLTSVVDAGGRRFAYAYREIERVGRPSPLPVVVDTGNEYASRPNGSFGGGRYSPNRAVAPRVPGNQTTPALTSVSGPGIGRIEVDYEEIRSGEFQRIRAVTQRRFRSAADTSAANTTVYTYGFDLENRSHPLIVRTWEVSGERTTEYEYDAFEMIPRRAVEPRGGGELTFTDQSAEKRARARRTIVRAPDNAALVTTSTFYVTDRSDDDTDAWRGPEEVWKEETVQGSSTTRTIYENFDAWGNPRRIVTETVDTGVSPHRTSRVTTNRLYETATATDYGNWSGASIAEVRLSGKPTDYVPVVFAQADVPDRRTARLDLVTAERRTISVPDGSGGTTTRVEEDRYAYDQWGHLIGTLRWAPSNVDATGGWLVELNTWDTTVRSTGFSGRLTEGVRYADGEAAGRTTYGYDAAGYPASQTQHDVVVDLGPMEATSEAVIDVTTTQSYDEKTGWQASQTDAAGFTTTYAYDALGRITRITAPPAEVGKPDRVTTVVYTDTVGALQVSVTGPAPSQMEYTFYDDGNVYRIDQWDTSGGSDTLVARRTIGYDAFDNIAWMVDPEGHAVGNTEAYRTSFTYDNLDRRTATYHPTTDAVFAFLAIAAVRKR